MQRLVCHVSAFLKGERQDTKHTFENTRKAGDFSLRVHQLHVRDLCAQIHYFVTEDLLHIKLRSLRKKDDVIDVGWCKLTCSELHFHDLPLSRNSGQLKDSAVISAAHPPAVPHCSFPLLVIQKALQVFTPWSHLNRVKNVTKTQHLKRKRWATQGRR